MISLVSDLWLSNSLLVGTLVAWDNTCYLCDGGAAYVQKTGLTCYHVGGQRIVPPCGQPTGGLPPGSCDGPPMCGV